ncbi:MAG: Na(+)-translocating NADH-quinone reductase subunit A [Prevotellaceae bacterium]|jgi:Na+-transporting NADH:ubiquinone oxidoreductase subunit A|nr:Na(+)-translocating NADH-quinone reductase subunit A [Prevotellaceae bacterium]
MSNMIRLRKGLDIKLKGKAEKIFSKEKLADTYAVKPTDFPGLTAKLIVKVGDTVKAGSPLFIDKYHPEVQYVSPVSGTVSEIRRGDRRKLLEVVVTPDAERVYEKFETPNLTKVAREEILELTLKSGTFPFLVQRPYGIVANPKDTPRDIFISGFDTAPLAPDIDFALTGEGDSFQAGIDALRKLTNGKVYLSLPDHVSATSIMKKAKGVEIYTFKGSHPAGNVGVQINNIAPINKGEIIWTITPQNVVALGRLFLQGIYNMSRLIAVVGSEVKKATYVKAIPGAALSSFSEYFIPESNARYISGNVLTGTALDKDGHIGFYSNQLTVIPEGDHYEFLGWAKPFRTKKFSFSRSYFSWLTPNKEYKLDTNLNGGERTFVVTGSYEKVLPMDIYPVHLIKAILAEDIDKMEQLGIYEVIEEDIALCEFIDPSKNEMQKILRDGINLMIKEMS